MGSPAVEAKPADKRQALEGFVITSHSSKKAIINGPGGSRVITDNQGIVLGGVEWKVDIVENGIEFLSGNDRVRLLFDRSLSSAGQRQLLRHHPLHLHHQVRQRRLKQRQINGMSNG